MPETNPAPVSSARPWWHRKTLWATGVAVVALLVLLGQGMTRDPRELPSALIGRPWPAFALPGMRPPHALTQQHLLGKPRVVNVWASWCTACREEHPVLMDLATQLRAEGRADQLLGINYKDTPQAALDWLRRGGDPYADSIIDVQGRLGMDLGVYGVPETFVTDAQGQIRYKHVGALTPEVVQREILPRLKEPS
jgi:cytochrome c biogenesis protein CcmG, thiol:disulfide interchange protein DsbE